MKQRNQNSLFRSVRIFLLAILLAATIAPAPAGPTVGRALAAPATATTLTATADTWIDETNVGDNYGACDELTMDASGANLGRGRILVEFDVSTIPSGATITDAYLQMTKIGGALDKRLVGAYYVTEEWDEGASGCGGAAGAVNWNERQTGMNWSYPGGTIFPIPSDNKYVDANGAYSWTVTSSVQAWVNNPGSNHGLMVASYQSAASYQFASRENGVSADRPQLIVTHTGGTTAVNGTVWTDSDRNGSQNGGEPGIQDVTVSLHDGACHETSALPVLTTVTASDGSYEFPTADPAEHCVALDESTLPPEMSTTTGNSPSDAIIDGANVQVDFGYSSRFADDRLAVGVYAPCSDISWLQTFATNHSASFLNQDFSACTFTLDVHPTTLIALRDSVLTDIRTRAAGPDVYTSGSFVPNDPDYNDPAKVFGPQQINAPIAWDVTTGDAGIIAAVLDTGIDASHPEFSGRLLTGYDFVNDDGNPADDQGHGTHVSGIMAAGINNGIGMAGIAGDVQILPVKVLNNNNTGWWSDVAAGITYAVDQGAKVLNLSITGSSGSTALQDAIAYANSKGATVVVAAGNEGVNALRYPASYDEVVAVGANGYSGSRWTLSNYGPNVDVMAPGQFIYSTASGGGYQFQTGTSMATPHVAGTTALLYSVNPNLTPAEVKDTLQETAVDLGDPGVDEYYGYGIIDAGAAVNAVPGEPLAPPTTGMTATHAVDVLGNGLVNPGDTLRYAIVAGNPNPAPLTNVVVSGTIPANTSYVVGSTRLNGIPVLDDSGPSTPFPLDEGGLNLGSVPANNSSTVTYDVVIGASVQGTYTAVANGGVSSDSGSNSMTVETEVAGTLLKLNVDKANAQRSETLNYEITSDYLGQAIFQNLVITAPIPAGTTYVGASANAGGSESGGVISWPLGSVVAGTSGSGVSRGPVLVEVGSFAKSTITATPTPQTIAHSLGVTPKAIIFWSGSNTNEFAAGNLKSVLGFTDGTTSHAISAYSEDNRAGSLAYRRITGDAIMEVAGIGTTAYFTADLTSWDADDFTLNWTKNTAFADLIHYMIIGGDSISANVVEWTAPPALGSFTVNGVGFRPDLVLHAHMGDDFTPAPDSGGINAGMSLGAMNAQGQQWVNGFTSMQGANPSNTQRGQQTDAAYYAFDANLNVTKKAAFEAMTADGFTLNFSQNNGNGGGRVVSLALGGVNSALGSFTKSAGGAPASQPITGLGIEPEAVLLATVNNTTQAGPVAHAAWALGASDGVNQAGAAYRDADGVTTTSADSIDRSTAILTKFNMATQLRDAVAEMTSLDADGFALNWSTNDSSPDEILYLALDSKPDPTPGIALWSLNNSSDYKPWDGVNFGADGVAANVGEQWGMVASAASPLIDEQVVIGIEPTDNDISAQIWNGSSWSQHPNNKLSINGGDGALFTVDAVYESQSGEPLLVWSDGASPNARIGFGYRSGGSWTNGVLHATPLSGAAQQIRLAAAPQSDEVALIASNAAGKDYAIIRDGGSWSPMITPDDSNGGAFAAVDVAYEHLSNHAMIAYAKNGAGNDGFYRFWDDSSWGPEGSIPAPAGVSSPVQWARLAAHRNSDHLLYAAMSGPASPQIWFNVWDGAAWGDNVAGLTAPNSASDFRFDAAFESASGRGLVVYEAGGATTLRYRTWNEETGWSNEQIGPTITATPSVLTLDADPNSNRIMLMALGSNNYVHNYLWDEGAWSSVNFSKQTGWNNGQPFAYTWSQHLPASNVPLSSALNTDATLVTAGDNVTVTMTLETARPLAGVTPMLSHATTNGVALTPVSGPTPSNATVGPGETTFTWVYQTSASGNVGEIIFIGDASDGEAYWPLAQADSILVHPSLTFQAKVNDPPGTPQIMATAFIDDAGGLLPSHASNTAITQLPGSIGDRVWNDRDGDRIQDAGEAGIDNVRVALTASGGGTSSQFTSGEGAYDFTGLSADTYTVTVDTGTVPAAFEFLTTQNPLVIAVGAGEDVDAADFGFKARSSAIGDSIWYDTDGDGLQEAGEPGIGNITLELWLDDGDGIFEPVQAIGADDYIGWTISNAAGAYRLDAPVEGSYFVNVTDDYGLLGTLAHTTGPQSVSNPSPPIPVVAGQVVQDVDFGYVRVPGAGAAVIGDLLWADGDGNSQRSLEEPVLIGVQVCATPTGGGATPCVTSDLNGRYRLVVPPGEYDIAPTNPPAGLMLTTASPHRVAVLGGEHYLDADFGYGPDVTALGRIGGQVWQDMPVSDLFDGLYDSVSEPGIPNVTTDLIQDLNDDGDWDDGEPYVAAVSDLSGEYWFEGLLAGNYLVKVSDTLAVLRNFAPTILPTSGSGSTDGVNKAQPYPVLLGAGEADSTADFGYREYEVAGAGEPPNPGIIGDLVWFDSNEDGVYRPEDGDQPFPGVTLRLQDISNGGQRQATTGINGAYLFSDLNLGDYRIDVTDDFGVLSAYTSTVLGPDNRMQPYDVTLPFFATSHMNGDFGYVRVPEGERGDCNFDKTVNAGDISALTLEIFDGDGNIPANVPGGTFAGQAVGCDANGDTKVDAGDISCAVLLIFNGAGACTQPLAAATNAGAEQAEIPASALMLPTQIEAQRGLTVAIPITLDANDEAINSAVFSVDYDETRFSFDPSDSDGDGLPDAIRFALPAGYAPGVNHDGADVDGELDITIVSLDPTATPISDGVVATVILNINASAGAGEAAVKFSADPAPALGAADGRAVKLQARGDASIIFIDGGAVIELPVADDGPEIELTVPATEDSSHIFLPVISSQ